MRYAIVVKLILLIWLNSVNFLPKCGVLADYELGDPYRILGVDRKAALQDIRRAYKLLAKEWHPDKNDDKRAHEKFVEIKKAYELLSDTDRRNAYDLRGITNEDAFMARSTHDYSTYGRYATDPFQEFFSHRFNFDQDISIFHKLSITARYFDTHVMPKSRNSPYLIMFYADWCFSCMKAASTFKKIQDALEPLGIVFATVNAAHENNLVRKASVHTMPCMTAVIDEKIYVYKENMFSVQKTVDFIRQKMPYKLLAAVKDDSLDQFLNGWEDNRVRALVMEPREQPRLRYLISAFNFRQRVAFGFVPLKTSMTANIQERYKVNPTVDTLLVFNENPNRPVASLSMADIPTQTLSDVISANKYLALPRLSSQDLLEGICPAEWNRPRKRLCVILITENTDAHNEAREALRKIALENAFSADRVRYAYIYQERQSDFVNALSRNVDETLLRLVIIWRRDTSHIKYEWIHGLSLHIPRPDNETAEHSYNITRKRLYDSLQRLSRTSESLSFEAEVKDLLDEHAQSFIVRIITRIFNFVEHLIDNVGEQHLMALISICATIVFIVAIGYLLAHLVRLEEEDIQKKQANGNNNNNANMKSIPYVPELKLHELRAEKYNGLVRLLKPGCRTIILVTDLRSRNKLIPKFHKAVWPYRKNKTLMFAHMLVERGASWYSELLRLSLSDSKDLVINPRNCIGTVLALNGHRKYFCIYHAKHPETSGGPKRLIKMTRDLSTSRGDPEAGAFLSMDGDESDESDHYGNGDVDANILLEENLLDGLSNWLDRLFEGTTHHYYVNYWPDFPTK